MNTGMEVRTSYCVCNLTAPFALRKVAQQKMLRHKSIVVESKAYTELVNEKALSSSGKHIFLASPIR
jgi:hypothetical protein